MHEGVRASFDAMAPRIRSTHVHDNDGKHDTHVFPLASEGGTIDWRDTMDILRSRPGQFPLLLELKEVPELKNPISVASSIFEKLETLDSKHER